jgi:site-specific recombinase XerD
MKTLRKMLEEYLAIRTAMGFKLDRPRRDLAEFVSFVEKMGKMSISTELVMDWINRSDRAGPVTRSGKLSMVRCFARYVSTEDPRTQVPDRDLIPLNRQKLVPYVYSDQEIRNLITAARLLRNPLIMHTYATLFGLLAVTGMRVGEAIRLDTNDFNDKDGLLIIRKSKFGKSRELLLHSSTATAIKAYIQFRNLHFSGRNCLALFISLAQKRLIYENINRMFVRLLAPAGFNHQKPGRPRLHDLRHTFAIRTLLDA